MAHETLTIEARVFIAAGYSGSIEITNITLASPPVASYTGADPADGDYVVITAPSGMIGMDGVVARVSGLDASANTFILEGDGLDTSTFPAWDAGSFVTVTDWVLAADVKEIQFADSAADKIDITRLMDRRKREKWGRKPAIEVTLPCLLLPDSPSLGIVRAAEAAGHQIAVRIDAKTGHKIAFAGEPSIGNSVMSGTDAATHMWRFILASEETWFGDTPSGAIGTIDTRPRYGVGAALLASDSAGIAALFATLVPATGSSNGSRVAGSSGSPLAVNPASGQYGWFACLASAAPSGVTFATALGDEGWGGAGMSGQNGGSSPIPSTAYISYTDGNSNIWHFFRQDLSGVAATFWAR